MIYSADDFYGDDETSGIVDPIALELEATARIDELPDGYGRECYLNLADELSADGARLDDFEPAFVDAAREFAAELALPFPLNDVDIALDLVERAERNER